MNQKKELLKNKSSEKDTTQIVHQFPGRDGISWRCQRTINMFSQGREKVEISITCKTPNHDLNGMYFKRHESNNKGPICLHGIKFLGIQVKWILTKDY